MKRTKRHLLTIILPIIAGVGVLLSLPYLKPLVKLEHALFWYPQLHRKGDFYADHGNREQFRVKVTPYGIEPMSGTHRAFVIDDEVTDILGNDHLTAANWAYLLHSLREKKMTSVVIAPNLSWDEPDELALRAIEHELSQFDNAVLGIELESSSVPQPLPDYLENSIIPYSGEIPDTIPRVNSTPNPPSIHSNVYGFSIIKSYQPSAERQKNWIPLLANWDGHLLPSLELAHLILASGESPKNVIFDPRGYLIIGKDQRIIPIDKESCVPVGQNIQPISAALSLDANSAELSSSYPVILVDQISPIHHHSMADSIKSIEWDSQTFKPTIFLRPFIAIEIAMIMIFVFLLQGRLPLYTLPFIFFFPLFAAQDQWLVISPFLAALITFLILISRTKIDPIEEKEIILPSEPPEKTPLKKKSPIQGL